MLSINFEVGSEKRFTNFISNLSEKDKIALISHTDLDGIASAKIINEVINTDYVFLVNYEDLNEKLISGLKEKKFTKIILADLMMDDMDFIKNASKHFEILWIDHHQIIEDVNSERIVYLNPGGNNLYCATYIAYYLFSKIKNLEEYDWLVACACLSDFTIEANKEWMKKIFVKYKDNSELKPMSLENGPIQNLKRKLEYALIYFSTKKELITVFNSIKPEFGNIGEIEKEAKEVEEEVKNTLGRFEKEKEEINNRYLFEFNPKFNIGAIVSNTISIQHPHSTIIALRPKEQKYAVSMRRQDSRENMNLLMKKVLEGLENAGGGGHIPAAGGGFMKKDLEKFKERLKSL